MTYQIYNEDCLEGMKRIADGSVDLILTDLPYGITDCDFDKRIPFAPMWEQFKRVTKRNAAICLFSQMPFGAELIMSNRKMFRYEWIWYKNQGAGFLNAKKMPLRIHENILVFYRQLPTYNPVIWYSIPRYCVHHKKHNSKNYGDCETNVYDNKNGTRYPVDVMQFKIDNNAINKYHPQQKPVALLEYLIKTYTNEGELVLDATMGSGSTGVAAINCGRKFTGFEMEQKFFNIAGNIIRDAIAKREQSLF